jgi:tetratricopeptide (TPR) repeat protein
VQQIETISILKSLSAVNRYGAIARGGVIQIKMKNSGKLLDDDGKPVNTALVKGNDYEETPDVIGRVLEKSSISSKLEKANSYEEALAVYKSAKQNLNSESIPFMVDASDYFMKWDTDFSIKILKEGIQKAFNNVKALKTIAYKLDEKGAFGEAKLVYQRIALLRPKDIQSYKDLALSYNAAGDYNEAMSLYKKMLANNLPDMDFSPIGEAIVNEVQHLVAHHRLEVDYKGLHPDLLSVKYKKDLRIVFDWNDPNVEFELQFVNPQKKYYNWIHTNFENRDRILDEVKYGYHTEEYIIDDADAGEWIINLEGLSTDDPNNPTYLKYTVFKNYGLPEETKEIKVIKLNTGQEKVTLDRFNYK